MGYLGWVLQSRLEAKHANPKIHTIVYNKYM